MGGNITTGAVPVYGTEGVLAATNTPGGRSQPVTWTDHKGNLWFFGGEGFDVNQNSEYLKDLWEYNPSTNEWAWMSGSSTPNEQGIQPGVYGALGVPAPGNVPPGRSGAVSWTDVDGNLWLFGGVSFPSTSGGLNYLNDLWRYTPATSEWTWVAGSNLPNEAGVYGTLGTASTANTPSARNNAVAANDAKGNFWLFGGAGYDAKGVQGDLSDLWKFNPTTGEWTWVNGPDVANQIAVPGTLQTPAPGNVPASRNGASGWADASGDFWIFGGSAMNDLWEFNASIGEWAWIGGDTSVIIDTPGHAGVYGTLQTPAAGNVPGGRTQASSWIDNKGNFWMFGGVGYDANDNQSMLDDLWQFNPSLKQWAWMGGIAAVPSSDCAIIANWCGQSGVYGILRTPALGNTPGGRFDAASWTDSKGNFWLYGGGGYDALNVVGSLNDLWEFEPNTAAQSIAATPSISPESGTYTSWQTITISDATPGATLSYSINGSTPALPYSQPITVNSSETIEAIAGSPGLANSNIATATYVESLPQASAPTFSLTPGTYASPQTVTLSDSTPGATIYYSINAPPTNASSVYKGAIAISSAESVEAFAVAEEYLDSSVATGAYNIGTNPPAAWAWMGGSNTIAQSCPASGNCSQPGWYGTLQTPAAANVPPARFGMVRWTDNHGNFWLFGGLGFDSVLNDLWEYKPAIGEWAWMAGSSSPSSGHPGVYGTMGTAAANNTPGSRSFAMGWTDSQGNLWLFGGNGLDENGHGGALNDLWKFATETGEWTWMGGDSTLFCPTGCYSRPGIYGKLGTPASTNIPGGRSAATTWTDSKGIFWLYGGFGVDARDIQCYPNDLWQFNPTTMEWTWVSGEQFASGIDTGYLSLYGAVGVPALANNPGSFLNTVSWTDTLGNLWLFGGLGIDLDGDGFTLNDMWEYEPGINSWAFPSTLSVDAPGGSSDGTYGTLGGFAATTIPGAREYASSWTDSAGNFWFFGGSAITALLNDLWEFKPALNEWAWMGGSDTIFCEDAGADICGQPGTYGTLGTPSSGNVPGARESAATWTDANGNLWIFGGMGFDSKSVEGYLNDLWQYSVTGTPTSAPVFAPAAAPSFSLAAGSYTSPQILTLSDSTPGATIYYATDGKTPTSTSPVYSSPFTISSSEAIAAVAISANYSASRVTTAAYTVSSPPPPTPTFSLSSSASSLTIATGQTGTLTFSVAPSNGFNSPVSFACSGLPSGATCSFSPATLTPAGAAASSTLTVTASATSAAVRGLSSLVPGFALSFTVCFLGWRGRRRLQLTVVLAIVLVGLGALEGCGGGGGSTSSGPTPPPPTTSTVTVTATAATLQQSITFVLTVN